MLPENQFDIKANNNFVKTCTLSGSNNSLTKKGKIGGGEHRFVGGVGSSSSGGGGGLSP